jgi:cytochrome c oxidase assembly factor CtaG
MCWYRSRPTGCILGLVASLLPLAATAHAERVVPPDNLLSAWRIDPVIAITLLLTGWLYWRGAARLNRIANRSRRLPLYSTSHHVLYWFGLLTLAVALVSPLDTVTGTVFSAHMIQHMLLIAVAPPLLLAGRPIPALVNGLPGAVLSATGSMARGLAWARASLALLALPVVAWLIHAAALWLWHEPHLYQAAVRQAWVHMAEHMSFIATALLFWWAIVPAGARTSALSPGMAIISLFGMGMQGAALGALMTFSGSTWYAVYEGRSELWGLSALSDQRLAGLIMWIPAGSIYVVASLLVLGRWLTDEPVSKAISARDYVATGMRE